MCPPIDIVDSNAITLSKHVVVQVDILNKLEDKLPQAMSTYARMHIDIAFRNLSLSAVPFEEYIPVAMYFDYS